MFWAELSRDLGTSCPVTDSKCLLYGILPSEIWRENLSEKKRPQL